jgi:hypothetical protein
MIDAIIGILAFESNIAPSIDVVIDERLYDGFLNENKKTDVNEAESHITADPDTVKADELLTLLHDLYQKHNETDDLVMLVTHNHTIELFYKMTEGFSDEKKKFHNSSISVIDMKGTIDIEDIRNYRSKGIDSLSGTWDFVDHMDHAELIKNHHYHPTPLACRSILNLTSRIYQIDEPRTSYHIPFHYLFLSMYSISATYRT